MTEERQGPEEAAGGTAAWRKDGLALAALAALGLAFLFELATLDGVPVARDIQLFFIPHRHLVWEAFQQGTLPLWTSLIGTGSPVLANFQSAVFYPPHWLYAATSFLAAFNWLIVLHVLLGGVGAYLFCREIRFSRTAAWIAAASFMLGGYLVSLSNLVNHLQAAAWTPLLAASLVRHLRRPGPLRFGLVVAVHLLAFLAGAPYTFLLAAGLSAGYAAVWTRTRAGTGTSWRTLALTLAAAAAAVAGLAAVQVLPTLQLVSESTRAGGLPPGEAANYSIQPARLVHLVVPNELSDPSYRFGHKLQLVDETPWLYSLYLGVVPLVLALFAATDRARRPEVLLWAGAALLGLTLGLGRHTPLFGLLRQGLPGFEAFRFPEKFFLLTGVSVPMLAGHGFGALRSGDEGTGPATAAAGLVAAAGVGAAAFWHLAPGSARSFVEAAFPGSPAAEHLDFAYRTWAGTLPRLAALAAAAAGAAWLHRKGLLRTRMLVTLVPLLVAADVWLAHRQLVPTVDPAFYRNRPAVASRLPMDELRTSYRYRGTPFDEHVGTYYSWSTLDMATVKWFAQQTVQPNTGTLHGMLTLDSGDAIKLTSVRDRQNSFSTLPDRLRWRLLELHGVKYLFSPRDYPERRYARRWPLDSLPGYVYELDDPLPRAYLGRGSVHPTGEAVVRAMLTTAAAGGRPAALVGDSAGRAPAELRSWAESRPGFELPDRGDRGRRPDSARVTEGTAEIVEDRGEVVRVRVDPREAAFLVLSDTPYPGWTAATAEGDRRPVLRANHFFRAVPVLPGDREVVFRYESAPLRTGARVSASALVLLLGGLGAWGLRRR